MSKAHALRRVLDIRARFSDDIRDKSFIFIDTITARLIT